MSNSPVTSDFVSVPHTPSWLAYSGGYATGLKLRLDEGLTAREERWLRTNAPPHLVSAPLADICDFLIDRYRLHLVTQRLLT